MASPNLYCDDSPDSELTRRYAKPRHRLISQLAYRNWLAHQSPTGSALQDWLEAEKDFDEGTRRRAYEIWMAKGCPSASALADWLEAEWDIGEESEIVGNLHPRRTDVVPNLTSDWQGNEARM